jgi:hypothetical protein
VLTALVLVPALLVVVARRSEVRSAEAAAA